MRAVGMQTWPPQAEGAAGKCLDNQPDRSTDANVEDAYRTGEVLLFSEMVKPYELLYGQFIDQPISADLFS
jgi:hypothetical protein